MLPQGLRVMQPQAHPGWMLHPPQQQMQRSLSSSNAVTAYLLSSPQGPQAILFSPQHGTFTGSMPLAGLRPTPTTTATAQPTPTAQAQPPAAAGLPPADPAAQVVRQQVPDGVNGQAAQQAADAGAQDPLGLQPIFNHFWLLFRILIFAYFLLGSGLGWQRPVILAGIGLGFWMVRLGVLGDGGAVRRWWEGVVGAPRRVQPAAPLEGQPQAQLGQAQGPQQPNNTGVQLAPAARPDNNANGTGNANGRQTMPTPEQVAARLLNQHRQGPDQQRQNWLRERVRPVERAVALFVASLWPGIGEGYVREQRRLREEEEAEARRRTEEESAARQAESAQKTEHGALAEEKSAADTEAASSTASEAQREKSGTAAVRAEGAEGS